jgi:putative nucleotidyltransferase with HDIG domain
MNTKNYLFRLKRFFRKIVEIVGVEEITEHVAKVLHRDLDVQFCAFYARDHETEKFVLSSFEINDPTIFDGIVKPEVFDYIQKLHDRELNAFEYAFFTPFFEKVLKVSQIKTIVPIFFNEEFLGCIFLGAKNDRQTCCSLEEIKFLKKIEYYASISLVNVIRYERLKDSYWDSVRSLANAIESKDVYTCGHSERVVEYSLIVGKEMGLSKKKLELLKFGGILHDIGKIAIDDEIIKKRTKLTPTEQQVIRLHPVEGEKMISPISFLKEAKNIIRHHHEKWDGSGYPDGLFKEEIPLLARVVQVVDTFDAITSSRFYRGRQTMDYALEEIKKFAGTQFDPSIVYYFLRAFKKGVFHKYEVK